MKKVALPIGLLILIATLFTASLRDDNSARSVLAQSLTPTEAPTVNYLDDPALQAFSDLLEYDPDCTAPSWWDIVLGSPDSTELASRVEQRLDIAFRTHVRSTSLITDYIFDYQYNEVLPAFRIILSEEAERISALEILFFGVVNPDSSLSVNQIVQELDYPNVFRNYGIPSEVWVAAGFNEALLLVYNEIGLAIYYIYRPLSNENFNEDLGTLQLCFKQKHLFDFRVYSVADSDRLSDLEQFEFMQPMEDVSDYSAEEYVALVLEDMSRCIETPPDLWGFEN